MDVGTFFSSSVNTYLEAMSSKGKAGRYRGSVKDFPNFDANQDAEALYNAMKGFGSDKDAILDLITSRSNKQRIEICHAYKALYGKDLIADLKYELTGKFERLIVGLMRPLEYFDAKEIKDALKVKDLFVIVSGTHDSTVSQFTVFTIVLTLGSSHGIGTDEKCLIEILASRTNQQIRALVEAYKDAYDRNLEEDVIADTSGHFKKMIIVLLQATREEDDVVSEELVEQDAKDLFEAGELQWGTDEAQFIYILGNRSKQHLRLVFDEYLKIAGKPIEASIRGELSGDFEKLMLAIVKNVRSTSEYFADRLFKAMKGLGTRDNTLIRIMVSRSEIDMLDIREIFRTKYEKSLHHMIESDTSGDYKKALLKLCGGDDDAAGEFFPEAAQVAYQMWELSAVAKAELKGTIRPAASFNADGDAKVLRKAMKGLGVLAKVILGLMMTPAQYDAKQLKKAVEGAGTDESVLIEILATRNNQEIQAINEAYKEAYHTTLEDALSSDTSGHFKRILVSLALGARDEGGEDLAKARADAQVVAETLKLADVSSDDSTSLETRFLSILCSQSYPQLRRVFQEFVKMTNHDVAHAIRKRMSGDVKDAFLAIGEYSLHEHNEDISSFGNALCMAPTRLYFHALLFLVFHLFEVMSVKNKQAFFAEKLYKSMKGAGTDDRTLIRIIVSRSEIDLLNIRREFWDLYDKSLYHMIEKDTSGDYCKALLAICGEEE
ncbi:hypothetical protein JD844_012277 [Phrynosoma platyrhinos]|uniref:Annexin n=1 Tax=Phrynosoma platyrhinos TaxID=52577 RepID=A0ABQ7TK09_PHRPL|nr:hypothetical protein JD844_012277 [Phrynosoma platyrhinos]